MVGGGIVGKACALLLAQQGMQVALIAPRLPAAAAAPDPGQWDSRIYAFSASSQALLERLRVWEALDPARMQPVCDMRVFGDASAAQADASAAGDLHFSAYAATVAQLAWIIESGHVERVLDTALRFQHQVHWHDDTAAAFARP